MGSFRRPKRKPDEDASDDALDQIAELLGVPIEAFTDETEALVDLKEASELFAIWNGLENPEDRERFLAFGRSLLKER